MRYACLLHVHTHTHHDPFQFEYVNECPYFSKKKQLPVTGKHFMLTTNDNNNRKICKILFCSFVPRLLFNFFSFDLIFIAMTMFVAFANAYAMDVAQNTLIVACVCECIYFLRLNRWLQYEDHFLLFWHGRFSQLCLRLNYLAFRLNHFFFFFLVVVIVIVVVSFIHCERVYDARKRAIVFWSR